MDRKEHQRKLHEYANAAARLRDFERAIALYDQVLATCLGEEDKLLQCTAFVERAEANLALHRYELTFDESNAVLGCLREAPDTREIVDIRRLAFYAAGRAAYSMRCFRTAHGYLQAAHNLLPLDSTARMLLSVQVRLTEETTGCYNFEEMLEQLIQNPNDPRMDHASFTTNTVIGMTTTAGRGLFAAKDLQLGDLVLVEKAFAVAFEGGAGGSVDHLPKLLSQVEEILRYSPALRNEFYSLTDGEQAPAQNPGSSDSSEQIRDMVIRNAFEFPSISTWHEMEQEMEIGRLSTERGTAALFIHASFFNHSCLANAKRSQIGDMMIVRAVKPIKKGEEIRISYMDTSAELQDRQEVFARGWDFQCSCKRCQVDATVTEEQQSYRSDLIEQAAAFIERAYGEEHGFAEPEDIEEAKRLLRELRVTYSHPAYQGMPHLPLIDLGRFLADHYLLYDIVKAEQTLMTLFMDLGLVREDGNGGMVLDLAGARDVPEFAMGQTLLAARMLHSKQMGAHKGVFVGLSREFYRILYGATTGFEEWADPHGTDWLTDLSVAYE